MCPVSIRNINESGCTKKVSQPSLVTGLHLNLFALEGNSPFVFRWALQCFSIRASPTSLGSGLEIVPSSSWHDSSRNFYLDLRKTLWMAFLASAKSILWKGSSSWQSKISSTRCLMFYFLDWFICSLAVADEETDISSTIILKKLVPWLKLTVNFRF